MQAVVLPQQMDGSTSGCPDHGLQRPPLDVAKQPPTSFFPIKYPKTIPLTTPDQRVGEYKSHISCPTTAMLHIQNIHCSKNRRDLTPSIGPQFPQQVHPRQNLQNDQSSSCSQNDHSPYILHINRHQKCIPPRPNEKESPQISSVLIQRPTLLHGGPPIRSVYRPLRLRQSNVISSEPDAREKNKLRLLFGRPPLMARVPPDSRAPYQSGFQHFKVLGNSSEFKEIHNAPHTHHRLARSHLERAIRCLEYPSRQTAGNKTTCTSTQVLPICHQKTMGSSHRTTEFHVQDSQEPQHPSPATLGSGQNQPSSYERRPFQAAPEPTGFPHPMDEERCMVRTTSVQPSTPSSAPLDRRIKRGVGSNNGHPQHCSGDLDSEGSPIPYQSTRIENSGTLNISIQPEKCHNNTGSRQRSGQICHQQGPLPLKDDLEGTLQPTNIMPEQKPSHNCDADSYPSQHHSGLSEQRPGINDRIINQTRDLRSHIRVEGSISSGFNGHTTKQTTKAVRQSDSTSGCTRVQRISGGLESVEQRIHLSTDQTFNATAPSYQELQGQGSHNSALATQGTMVPRAVEIHSGPHPSSPTPEGSTSQQQASIRIQQIQSMDRIGFLRACLSQKRGPKAADKIIKGYRASSLRQAQTAWSTFKAWIPENITSITHQTILDFLIFLHEVKKLSPRTVLGYKNSLAWPMLEAFNLDLKHQDFKLLIKSMFHESPTTPRLVPSWSLNHALETISTSYKKPTSSTDMFLKALFLTALASGNRVSELSAMTRNGLMINNNSITLPLRKNFLYKNQTLTRTPSPITFTGLGPRHPLCPIYAIQLYLEKTKDSPHKGNLFLHPLTGLPLGGGRLGYWLAKAISKFDSSAKGRPHDLRKFAFSASWARGTHLNDIIRTGFWNSPNPFLNHYCIKINDPLPKCVAGRKSI